MHLLDAGCGQGVVASYLAKNYGVSVTGITVVPYEIKSACKVAKKAGVSQLTNFILADYANPPFEPGSFDRIYTTETLSHAVDLDKVLNVFYTLLKPGGKLVCAEYEFDYSKFSNEEENAAQFVKKYGAIHGIYQFDIGQFPKRLKDIGFDSIKEFDWSKNVQPSIQRLERLARPLSVPAKTFGVERHFVNSVSAGMYTKALIKKVFAYKVYSAEKPS